MWPFPRYCPITINFVNASHFRLNTTRIHFFQTKPHLFPAYQEFFQNLQIFHILFLSQRFQNAQLFVSMRKLFFVTYITTVIGKNVFFSLLLCCYYKYSRIGLTKCKRLLYTRSSQKGVESPSHVACEASMKIKFNPSLVPWGV